MNREGIGSETVTHLCKYNFNVEQILEQTSIMMKTWARFQPQKPSMYNNIDCGTPDAQSQTSKFSLHCISSI